ncbi:MAG: hypothetical protein R3Y44_05650 [Rikenellaceae bacterium]
MKKIIMMVAAVLIFSAPATMAQKIKAETYQAKLEKSDEAIANPKKAAKVATWVDRGNVYFEALQTPVASLFISMDLTMLKAVSGEPQSTKNETIGGTSYEVLVYPYFNAYVADSKLVGWKITKEITSEATQTAIDAYTKAYELDPSEAKIKEGLERLANYYAQIGDISNTLSDFASGGAAYTQVYDIQNHPAYNTANPMMLYYSGYMYTIGANEDKSLYPAGVIALNRAVEAGYPESELKITDVDDKEKGNIFYYLYHCYYGQKDVDSANILKAKEALVKGVEMFPKNQKIIDALTQLYTTEEGMGDPSELVAMIDNAIAADPSNADLWFARGRVFFSLEDFDNCIESFSEYTKLAPDVFDGHFYLGLFYIYKGDGLNEEIGSRTYTENAAYAKDLEEVNEIYAAAIPILERALEIKSDDLSTVEYLKSLCFRLRDEDGIMDKYTKYNDMFNEMKANQ